MYPGNSVVERSIALGEPVIYVSANYRLNGSFVTLKTDDLPHTFFTYLSHFNQAFGFLPGKEVLAAGITNAGIRDRTLVPLVTKKKKEVGIKILTLIYFRTLCLGMGTR